MRTLITVFTLFWASLLAGCTDKPIDEHANEKLRIYIAASADWSQGVNFPRLAEAFQLCLGDLGDYPSCPIVIRRARDVAQAVASCENATWDWCWQLMSLRRLHAAAFAAIGAAAPLDLSVLSTRAMRDNELMQIPLAGQDLASEIWREWWLTWWGHSALLLIVATPLAFWLRQAISERRAKREHQARMDSLNEETRRREYYLEVQEGVVEDIMRAINYIEEPNEHGVIPHQPALGTTMDLRAEADSNPTAAEADSSIEPATLPSPTSTSPIERIAAQLMQVGGSAAGAKAALRAALESDRRTASRRHL